MYSPAKLPLQIKHLFLKKTFYKILKEKSSLKSPRSGLTWTKHDINICIYLLQTLNCCVENSRGQEGRQRQEGTFYVILGGTATLGAEQCRAVCLCTVETARQADVQGVWRREGEGSSEHRGKTRWLSFLHTSLAKLRLPVNRGGQAPISLRRQARRLGWLALEVTEFPSP